MNIKSLLLGSAAALAVTTGAQAADAIMAAQPEPVDYVKVCDAFGTGYFYIPGTETCLRVHGYLRQEVGFGDIDGTVNAVTGDNATHFRSRFSFQTDTNSNTELGVLHTYTEVRFTLDNGYAPGPNLSAGNNLTTSLNFAYIELGGFRVGKTESEFDRLQFYGHGYAGGVIQDTLVPYGPFDTQQISYTYKNNGFAAVIALEDDNTDGSNYIPDLLAGLSYDNGTFGAAIIGALDEDNVVPGGNNDADGAIKARVDAKFGRFQAFLMGGYSTSGGVSGGVEAPSNRFANWGGDWAVWGGASTDLTQKVSANLQLSYDDVSTFGAAGNLVFHVVPGFDVTTEVDYQQVENPVGGGGSQDNWGGLVRFQRTF